MGLSQPGSSAVPEFVDLLTGDSSDFDGSIGTWAAIAGGGAALSYDAGIGILGKGSVKIHQTASGGPGGQVTLPGVYATGKRYQLLVALWMEAYVATDQALVSVEFGDFVASDTSGDTNNEQVWFNQPNYSGMPFDTWVYNVVEWEPTADRTNPVVRVRIAAEIPARTVDNDYHVGLLRSIDVTDNKAGFIMHPVGRVSPNGGVGKEYLLVPMGQNDGNTGFALPNGVKVNLRPYGVELESASNDNGDNSEVLVTRQGVYVGATQKTIGRRGAAANYDAIDEEFGPDYVGLLRGERSANEVEIQPDGSYDVIHVDGFNDGDTGHRTRFETADGLGTATPSWGALPKYAAAPHVGVEEEGESYYDTVLHKSRTWDGTVWQDHF